VEDTDPTPNVNPDQVNVVWYNRISGEIFICVDNTPDANRWIGTSGKIIAPTTLNKFDFFGDNSTILVFNFDGNLLDLGGRYNGEVNGTGLKYALGRYSQAVKSYYNHYNIKVHIPEMNNYDVITVSAWLKWSGFSCCVMPFGFTRYDIYTCCGNFGFNTSCADIFGISDATSKLYRQGFFHIVAEFHKGDDFYNNKLWINGEPQILSQQRGTPCLKYAEFGEYFYIFGWGANSAYRHFGKVDQLRMFNRALTDDEVRALYNEQ
jgi:hypothetical protein